MEKDNFRYLEKDRIPDGYFLRRDGDKVTGDASVTGDTGPTGPAGGGTGNTGDTGPTEADVVAVIKIIADDVALTVGDGKTRFTIPEKLNGMNLTVAEAHVYTASSAGTPTFQIHNETNGQDVLSTEITIDANEIDSTTAAVPPVIDGAQDHVATADVYRFDCDVAGTGTKGGEIRMQFVLP